MDYSAVREHARSLVDDPADLVAYLDDHPEEFDALIDRRRFVDVDETYLEFVGADSLSHLVDNVDRTSTEQTGSATKELLQAVATGDTSLAQECPVRNLEDGSRRWLERELLVPVTLRVCSGTGGTNRRESHPAAGDVPPRDGPRRRRPNGPERRG